MTYKINGIPVVIQPTTGQWIPRQSYGLDGDNRQIYPGVHSFRMRFDAITIEAYNQLYNFWNTTSSTGSVSAELPKKDDPDYTFTTYEECFVDEPVQGEYFNEHLLRVEILVRNITL